MNSYRQTLAVIVLLIALYTDLLIVSLTGSLFIEAIMSPIIRLFFSLLIGGIAGFLVNINRQKLQMTDSLRHLLVILWLNAVLLSLML